MIVHTEIKNGKFPDKVRQLIVKEIQSLEGKRVRLELTKARKKRSILQNNAYHGIAVKLITEFFRDKGYQVNESEVHEWIKSKFLGYDIYYINGEEIKILKSTANLTTMGMMTLYQDLQIYFAPLGLDIPDPDPDYLENNQRG